MITYIELLLLFLGSSPLLFLVAKVFVKVVEAIGKKCGFAKDVGFLLTGLMAAAISLTPFFLGFLIAIEDYPSHRERLFVMFMMYPIALVPSVMHIRKNIEVFYSAGYWKRLK